MKILHALFEIQDYGGIVPYVETLTQAYQELNHTVELALLRPSPRAVYTRKRQAAGTEYASRITGAQVHLLSGWYGVPVFGFGSLPNMDWVRYAEKFDMVIFHTAPKVTDRGWQNPFNTGATRTLFIAHDAHYHRAYEHIDLVYQLLDGVVGVHQAAYNNLENYPGRRALIGNPHVPLPWTTQKTWSKRRKQSVCAHVWKGWKRMHRYVAAAPHMETYPVMGGDGIEGRYMRSPTKCPKKYQGFWKAYLASGAEYLGILQPRELQSLYLQSRVMVDLSASKRFANYGNHINRSTFDAWNCGLVPVGTEMNMNPLCDDTFSDAYFSVPSDCTPEGLAEQIDEVVNLGSVQAARYVEAGREILTRHYDYRHVCVELIRLSQGESCGQENNYD